MTLPTSKYQPKHHIRMVTAASLFDGHDAAINIMRRIIQATGVEVIHLGHNRSAQEIVDCAIQEDVQAIAITSYQGGHVEFFKYIHDLLQEKGATHVKIFGGGGGTILPEEIQLLQDYGITRIYSPDDGRAMGLQGMINHLVEACDFPLGGDVDAAGELAVQEIGQVARLISAFENFPERSSALLDKVRKASQKAVVPVLGITGTGGAGKSSLVDELVRRFLMDFEDKRVAIISVDPSKRKTGGALLGDRIRMNAIHHPRVFMRSLATRQSNLALSKYVQDAVDTVKAAGFDLVILETSGIGQSDTEIIEHSDLSLYVMTPEYGAASQLEKIDMLDFADLIALNKFGKLGMCSADVDKVWHAHILFTRKYAADCEALCGRFIHHQPTSEEEKLKRDRTSAKNTQAALLEIFGEVHPVWLLSGKAGRFEDECGDECSTKSCQSHECTVGDCQKINCTNECKSTGCEDD
jgi:methylmalonyl-CoA mutase